MKTRKLHTTLRLLKDCDACVDGYKKLRRYLPIGWKLDTHIPLATILESNGIDDALWALRAVLSDEEIDRDKIARLMAADFAEHVLSIWQKHNPGDDRPAQAIATARRFALGEATKEELAAARDAARAAARAAAWVAAWDAAGTAARVAAWDAARDAERKWQAGVLLQYLEGNK